MSHASFLQNAVKWRLTGGHTNELKRLGVQSGQGTAAAGSAVLSDAVLPALTSGTNVTAVGVGALKNLTSGTNVFALGKDAGTDGVRNITTQNNEGVLGNNSTTTIYAKVALTVTSDERDKTSFAELPWTQEMFSRIKVGLYQFRDRTSGELTRGQRYGFSAQNLMAVEQASAGVNVLVDSSDPDHLKLHESTMLPILVKMVQELSEQVQQLRNQLGMGN